MEKVFEKAKRIWDTPSEEPNQYRRFLCRFLHHAVPNSPILRIRVDNRYAVSLNGHSYDAQMYSDYDFFATYDEIPLNPADFCDGENVLDILAYCANEDSSTYRRGEPSLIFELTDGTTVLAASGESTEVASDTPFESGAGVEKLTEQLSFGFRYDAEKEGCETYRPATVLPERPFVYHQRPIPQLTVGPLKSAAVIQTGSYRKSPSAVTSGERIKTDEFTETRTFRSPCKILFGKRLPSKKGIEFAKNGGDGCYFIADFGEETVGFLSLQFELSAPSDVTVGFGEHLSDGRVRAVIEERNFAFSIHAKAGKNEVYWPMKRIGCRYLELHFDAPSVRVYAANIRPVNYPVKVRPMPRGMNSFEKKTYRIALATLRACMHEHYEDCPWREQALYTMDSRNQMLFGYGAFGETVLPRESIRLLALGQQESGLLELCAPAKLPHKVTIPSFTLIWVTQLEEYYRETGDLAFVSEMIPTLDRILAFFASDETPLCKTPKGIWNFYEWAPYLDGRGTPEQKADREAHFDAPLNAFYGMALRAAAALYQAVGNTEKAEITHTRYANLAQAYRNTFWDPTVRAFVLSDSPAYCHITPELVEALSIRAGFSEGEEACDLCRRILGEAFSPLTTLSHRIYVYEVLLAQTGLEKEVLADVKKHWGPMVAAGATTFWETEEGAPAFRNAGSLCHGWSAAPLWVYRRIFGKSRG